MLPTSLLRNLRVRKTQQTGFPKMFLKKTFWDVLIALFRFFSYPKFPPIKHHNFYSCASVKDFSALAIHLGISSDLRTFVRWRLEIRKTGFPKMFLQKTFWDKKSIGHLFRFLRTQSFHLSNNLTQSRIHFNITYQVAEFKLGLIFSMCLRMSADLFLKLNIRRSI